MTSLTGGEFSRGDPSFGPAVALCSADASPRVAVELSFADLSIDR
jgi:hypothetical protein